MEIELRSLQDTQKLAVEIAKEVARKGGPFVIALYGDLGAGKTTWVQFLAKALGVKEKVLSPSYLIIKAFQRDTNTRMRANDANKIKYLVHIDAYRLARAKELLDLGLKEILQDKENIVAIEWPEKMEKYLPKSSKRIYFKVAGPKERRVIIK